MSQTTCHRLDRIIKANGTTEIAETPEKFLTQVVTDIGHRITSARGMRAYTEDINALIETNLYDPSRQNDTPNYDQIRAAVEKCSSREDAGLLWCIARACKFLGAESLTRYAAQEAILTEGDFVTETAEKPETYYYERESGVYRDNGGARIAQLVNDNIPDASIDLINNVIKKVQAKTQVPWERFEAPSLQICVRNGVLDMTPLPQGEPPLLHQHSPEVIFLSRINARYDPKAQCPSFEEFLRSVHHPEDVPAIEEVWGSLLDNRPVWDFLVFFIGAGRNGKTTEMTVMRAFLGPGNYASVPLHDLLRLPFARSDLYGRLANLSGDVSDQPLTHTGLLKQLSGGDEITAPRKFRSPIRFVWGGKAVFGMNKAPFTPDVSGAFWARVKLFEFPNTFPADDSRTDPFLEDRLTTETELSGILNLALRGLGRLLRNKRLSYTKTPREVDEAWSISSDPVRGFVEACLEPLPNAGTLKADTYQAYRQYCDQNKVRPVYDNMFAKELRRVMPWIREDRPTIDGKRVQRWLGFRVRGDERNYLEKSTQNLDTLDRHLAMANGQGCQGSLQTQGEKVTNGGEDSGEDGYESPLTALTEEGSKLESGNPASGVVALSGVPDPLRQVFNEKIDDLQKRACPDGKTHRVELLQKSILFLANPEEPSAFRLRQHLARMFPDHRDDAIALVDGFFNELIELGDILRQMKQLEGGP